nr:hypothetical protein [Tanacetum cinerariifolium]
ESAVLADGEGFAGERGGFLAVQLFEKLDYLVAAEVAEPAVGAALDAGQALAAHRVADDNRGLSIAERQVLEGLFQRHKIVAARIEGYAHRYARQVT